MVKHYVMVPTAFAIMIIALCILFVMKNSTKEFTVSEVLTMTIPEFPPGGTIPDEFTCKGLNISPSVIISNVPGNTKSLALVMHDPDAPGGTFYHWLVWNIPPNTTELNVASLPGDAVTGTNSFGKIGYGGPCPPSGTHQYVFTLYALDGSLPIGADSRFTELKTELDRHTLGKVNYTGVVSAKTTPNNP